MKRNGKYGIATVLFLMTSNLSASDAETSASAGHARTLRNGSAAATARYDGDIGFARTETSSGDVSRARGVAVGVDKDGLTFSLSNAFVARNGLGLATNLNISIDRDGRVSRSGGIALADSPFERSVTAGGGASNDRGRAAMTAYATGRTDPYGRVDARTYADSSRAPLPSHRPLGRGGEVVIGPAPAYPEHGVVVGQRVAVSETVRRTEQTKVIRTAPSQAVRYIRVGR